MISSGYSSPLPPLPRSSGSASLVLFFRCFFFFLAIFQACSWKTLVLQASSEPCFLPHSCYCAALASLFECINSDSELGDALLSLCRPDHLARRAPGMAMNDSSGTLYDVTALKILQDLDLAEDLLPLYSDLAQVWKYNAFETGDGRMAIFLLLSLFNHSCIPAADYTMCREDDGTVEIILSSLHSLAAGDAITICYIEDNEEHKNSRVLRRNTLAEGWLFYCLCDKCGDENPVIRCESCAEEMQVWISNVHGGPYEDSGEAPTCDFCGEEDLVVSGPYFFHCAFCEMDLCEKCADGSSEKALESGGKKVCPRRCPWSWAMNSRISSCVFMTDRHDKFLVAFICSKTKVLDFIVFKSDLQVIWTDLKSTDTQIQATTPALGTMANTVNSGQKCCKIIITPWFRFFRN